ncbi:MAG: helix-turn-helix transcriptional regulator [Lentisphaeria bacterium]|nr:helix-turn-helix transcriptional regulator [Lentisphaeria bacterium]
MEYPEIPVPRRYRSISSGVRRSSSGLPDNVLVYDRHKINPRAGFFHQNDAFFVIYCVRGSGTVCLDEDFFDFRPGNILLMFPWQMHCYLDLELPRRWLYVRAEWDPPETVYRLRNQLMTARPEEVELLARMARIWNECEESAAAWKADYLSGMTATLVCGLLDRCRNAETVLRPVPGKHRLLEKINGYIYQNLGRPFNIQQMAAELGYSPNYLGAAFKGKYFITLEEYIKTLRIDRAKNRLSGTTLSVGEIAAELGFSSLYSFSNCFRRTTGRSPTEYRSASRK